MFAFYFFFNEKKTCSLTSGTKCIPSEAHIYTSRTYARTRTLIVHQLIPLQNGRSGKWWIRSLAVERFAIAKKENEQETANF